VYHSAVGLASYFIQSTPVARGRSTRHRFHGYVSTKSAMYLSSLRVTSSSRDRSTLCQISVNVEHLRCFATTLAARIVSLSYNRTGSQKILKDIHFVIKYKTNVQQKHFAVKLTCVLIRVMLRCFVLIEM